MPEKEIQPLRVSSAQRERPFLLHCADRQKKRPKIPEGKHCFIKQIFIPDAFDVTLHIFEKPDIMFRIIAISIPADFPVLLLRIMLFNLKFYGKRASPVFWLNVRQPI